MAIVVLLDEALTARGLWPPPREGGETKTLYSEEAPGLPSAKDYQCRVDGSRETDSRRHRRNG
jgi:hypothetical protein